MLVEKSINFLRFFHFIEMLSKSFFKFRFSLATYCIPQPFSQRVRTYISSLERQFKSVIFTIENCLPLTVERMVDLQFK